METYQSYGRGKKKRILARLLFMGLCVCASLGSVDRAEIAFFYRRKGISVDG